MVADIQLGMALAIFECVNILAWTEKINNINVVHAEQLCVTVNNYISIKILCSLLSWKYVVLIGAYNKSLCLMRTI